MALGSTLTVAPNSIDKAFSHAPGVSPAPGVSSAPGKAIESISTGSVTGAVDSDGDDDSPVSGALVSLLTTTLTDRHGNKVGSGDLSGDNDFVDTITLGAPSGSAPSRFFPFCCAKWLFIGFYQWM